MANFVIKTVEGKYIKDAVGGVNDKILLLTSELYAAKKYQARGAAAFLLKRYEEKNLISQGATVLNINA